jgi:hypothetical protein
MSIAEVYRQNAESERVAAGKEILPRRRLQREHSSERWEEMARAAEETARRTAINDALRAARPEPR